MKPPPGGLMVCAIVVSGPPLPRKTPCRRARCSGVAHSSLVVSRRRFPWNATSPSSLMEGSEGRLVNPLSQKVGESAIDAVSAMTNGRSFAPRLVMIPVSPDTVSRTVTATVPGVLMAAHRVGSRPSRRLSRIVVNVYFGPPDPWPGPPAWAGAPPMMTIERRTAAAPPPATCRIAPFSSVL